MMSAHRFITFEKIESAGGPTLAGAGPLQVSTPNRLAAAGDHFSFGSGPSNHKPGSIGQGRARNRVICSAAAKLNLWLMCRRSSAASPSAARAFLKFSQLSQAVIDGFAVIYLVLFGALLCCAVVGAPIMLGVVVLLFKF